MSHLRLACIQKKREKRRKRAYSIFVRKDLSHIENAVRDVRHGLATKSYARGAVVPGTADVEFDIFAVGLIFEGDG